MEHELQPLDPSNALDYQKYNTKVRYDDQSFPASQHLP